MVKHSPPASSILLRAVAVKRRAATVTFGTLSKRTSSVMVATATMILSSRAEAVSRESDTGGRLIRLANRRRRMTALKGAEVRPGKTRVVSLAFLIKLKVEWEGRHAGEKAVKLYEKFKVDVVAFGGFAMTAPHMMLVEIDT